MSLPLNRIVEDIEVVFSESTWPMVAISCSVSASDNSDEPDVDVSTRGRTARLSIDAGLAPTCPSDDETGDHGHENRCGQAQRKAKTGMAKSGRLNGGAA